ncbi:hypothetical protein [Peribacillus aracenensis]|uniref:hypothetical protein n=1 Tax=Peribacillus aracenensis TaxID=2976708 RepID=UPI0021A879C9|nr:hypothetical protein [Peribacillus sp. BBB004]
MGVYITLFKGINSQLGKKHFIQDSYETNVHTKQVLLLQEVLEILSKMKRNAGLLAPKLY